MLAAGESVTSTDCSQNTLGRDSNDSDQNLPSHQAAVGQLDASSKTPNVKQTNDLGGEACSRRYSVEITIHRKGVTDADGSDTLVEDICGQYDSFVHFEPIDDIQLQSSM